MSWRFYPLAEDPHTGVLVKGERRSFPAPKAAEFLTPEQAKSLQERKGKAA